MGFFGLLGSKKKKGVEIKTVQSVQSGNDSKVGSPGAVKQNVNQLQKAMQDRKKALDY